jgi:hypothetical protein
MFRLKALLPYFFEGRTVKRPLVKGHFVTRRSEKEGFVGLP